MTGFFKGEEDKMMAAPPPKQKRGVAPYALPTVLITNLIDCTQCTISVQCTLFKSYSKQVGNVSNSFKKMNYVYCSHQRFLKTKKLNILNKRLI